MNDSLPTQVSIFHTSLGWAGIAGRGSVLQGLTFGQPDAGAVQAYMDEVLPGTVRNDRWNTSLRRRLEVFAEGVPDDFRDVVVEPVLQTAFGRAVVEACRQIGYGETLSYGQLARRVGAPGAARAVGNVMRTNRCPLVVPCHRVVHGDGRIGNFSAPQGASMKQRLLDMEQASALFGLSAGKRQRTPVKV